MQIMAAGMALRHPSRGPRPLPGEHTMPEAATVPRSRAMSGHRARELTTIGVMVRMYCRDHHGTGGALCNECRALMDYATRRLERCVFGDDKPTCANCTVHCYTKEMRERIRDVMRYAGPRMLLRHPWLGITHLIDGRRPAPELPKKSPKPVPAASDADGPGRAD
jgi:Nitrous oxide-stimulated promoter